MLTIKLSLDDAEMARAWLASILSHEHEAVPSAERDSLIGQLERIIRGFDAAYAEHESCTR